MNRILSLLLIGISCFLMTSCKEVAEEFSGLQGRVALGPVSGANIEIFDATQIVEGTSAGLITTSKTDARGNFRVPLADAYIGRTLLIFAQFPVDDPLTTPDERATLVDYDGAGQTIALEPEHGPWVCMLDYFDGFEVTVAVTPYTTMAYHALRAMPDGQVGAGRQRFVQQHVRNANWALTTSLGLASDIARTIPAEPRFGGNHPSGPVGEENNDSRAAHLALMQLDRALRTFTSATTSTSDGLADALQALWLDAADGIVDGSNHEEAVAFFAQAGAPDVLGFQANGSSKLIGWVADNSALSSAELIQLGATFPAETAIRDAQRLSTGACQPPVIEGLSSIVWPERGNAEVVIRGRGLLRTSRFYFASNEAVTTFRSGEVYEINDNMTREGHILSIRHDEIRIHTPDMRTLAESFRPAATSNNFRDSNLFLFMDRDTPSRYNKPEDGIVADDIEFFVEKIRSVYTPGIALVGADLLSTQGQEMVGVQTLDPTLDPSTNAESELRLRVYNGLDVAVEGVNLDVALSSLTKATGAATLGRFSEGTFDLTLPSEADLLNLSINLAAKSEGTIVIPFTLSNSVLTEGIGSLVHLMAVISGQRSDDLTILHSDDDPRQINALAQISVQDHEAMPLPTLSVPNTSSSGTTTTITMDIQVTSAGALMARDIIIEGMTLRVMLEDGRETVQYLRGQGAAPLPSDFPAIGRVTLTSALGSVFPLRITAAGASVSIPLTTSNLIAGSHTLFFDLEWSDSVTGQRGTMSQQTTLVQP